MKVLLTGARAPACLDLARSFAQAGHRVWLADSLSKPLAKGSKWIETCFLVPPPKFATRAFIDALAQHIARLGIDLLVPTCEEVFFLSRFQDQLGCAVYCDSFDKLAAVHNKFRFHQMAQGLGIQVPETHLLRRREDLESFLPTASDWVFKPVFSRFAAFTRIGAKAEQLADLRPSTERAWVAQRRIHGRELCSYGVADHGQLRVAACYEPLYRLKHSSGVYFEPIDHPGVRHFAEAFAKAWQFHGQLCFDFIESADGALYVLECNPRATSGIHLFGGDPMLAAGFAPGAALIQPVQRRPSMLSPVMLCYNLPRALARGQARQFWRDIRRAHEAGHHPDDPWPSLYRFVGVFEVILKSLRQRISLREAATADLEWDGEPL